jgi:hypothetical protein
MKNHQGRCGSRAPGRASGDDAAPVPLRQPESSRSTPRARERPRSTAPPGSDGSRNSVFTRVFLKAVGTRMLNAKTLGAMVREEVHELAR